MANDSIVAIATPAGHGALAIIRLSGNSVREVAARIFVPLGNKSIKPWHVHYGQIRHPHTQEWIDEVILTYFKAPRSYTGEDMIEVTCHGSPVVAEAILAACVDAGLRQAAPGEFTLRAFHNGRIDLSQAESIALLTAASSNAERRAALAILAGGLSSPLNRIRNNLISAIAGIELELDFPEEDASIPIERIIEWLRDAHSEITSILSAGARTARLARGIRVVIVGNVNAGKSRLFNRLSGVDRSIVTSEPGTTRDPIEIGLPGPLMDITLVDTAGLRITHSIAEAEGIERTRRNIEAADLILAVVDATSSDFSVFEPLMQFVDRVSIIVVCNKMDLVTEKPNDLVDQLIVRFPGAPCAWVSALRGDGVDALRTMIWERAGASGAQAGNYLAITARNRTALTACISLIDEAIRGMTERIPGECISPLLRSMCDQIAEILGENIPPDILGTIFSSFCIGK